MRALTVSLLGAAAVAASLVLLRQQREDTRPPSRLVPPGETLPSDISLDRLRELGF